MPILSLRHHNTNFNLFLLFLVKQATYKKNTFALIQGDFSSYNLAEFYLRSYAAQFETIVC